MENKTIFTLENFVNETVDTFAGSSNNYNPLSKTIIAVLVETNPEGLLEYTKSKSTIFLRDLCIKAGFDYWGSLADSNAVDFIDSAFANS